MRRLLTRRRGGSTAVGAAGLVAALLSLALLAGACSDSDPGQANKVDAGATSAAPGPATDAPGAAAIPAASPNEGAASTPAGSSPSTPGSSTVSAAPKVGAKEAAAQGPAPQS